MEKYRNEQFNNIIDKLFTETDITNEKIKNIINDETILNFFYIILKCFSPEEIRKIFLNTDPKNDNLSMVFKENVQEILKDFKFPNFFETYNSYIKYAFNQKDLSHIQLCYDVCKYFIKLSTQQNYERNDLNKKIPIIIDLVILLCFEINKIFTDENDNISENKSKKNLIIKESFILLKEFNKAKYKINSLSISKNKIIELIDYYNQNFSDISTHILILLLYYIFQHRNFHYYLISLQQNQTNSEIFKENFYAYFDLINLYHNYFKINNNFEIENLFITIMSQITKFFPKYSVLNKVLSENIQRYENEKNVNLNSFNDIKFCVNNLKILNEVFFYKNPYKSVIIFVNLIMNKNNNLNFDSVNYYDLDKLFENFSIFLSDNTIDNYSNDKNILEIKKYACSFFIKVLIVIFIFFSSDLIIYSPIIESDKTKFQRYSNQFFIKLLNKLYLMSKNFNSYMNKETKDNQFCVMNEIIMNNPEVFKYMIINENLFNQDFIKFLIYNIDSAKIASNYLKDLYKIDKAIIPTFYLNKLIIFGYWVNKYPMKDMFDKGLNILYCIQTGMDFRGLLKTEENVNKFILGIYLFFKAFPKSENETINFMNFLSKNIDYSFESKTKEKIHNLCQFIKKDIFANEAYFNKNTTYINIEEYLKNISNN